ncbi:MAG: hypothetical protein R3A46_15050 [Thermomicrobiales bacterium]
MLFDLIFWLVFLTSVSALVGSYLFDELDTALFYLLLVVAMPAILVYRAASAAAHRLGRAMAEGAAHFKRSPDGHANEDLWVLKPIAGSLFYLVLFSIVAIGDYAFIAPTIAAIFDIAPPPVPFGLDMLAAAVWVASITLAGLIWADASGRTTYCRPGGTCRRRSDSWWRA